MNFSDKIASCFSDLGASLKSVVKLLLQSRRSSITIAKQAAEGKKLIILGNGPSLKELIDNHISLLSEATTMAVNFAANADAFTIIKPDFYLLADPHFFSGRKDDSNVELLFKRFDESVDWDMTIYVPTGHTKKSLGISNSHIKIENFNFLGIEGFECFEDKVYDSGRGMPRPRNVLVPAIMVAIKAGFKTIYLAGADHSWLTTLSVNDNNEVVSIQPHFYKDNDEEKARVSSVYRNVRLHDMLMSMHIAFKSYHRIERYAKRHDVDIFNASPGSFIDAFRRKDLFS